MDYGWYVPKVEADGFRYYDVGTTVARRMREDKTKCAYEILDFSRWHHQQCSRPRGHGPEGLFCKQHAKIVENEIPKKEDKQ